MPPAEGIERLAATIAILRRMWTEDVFDFDGRHSTLRGTVNSTDPCSGPVRRS